MRRDETWRCGNLLKDGRGTFKECFPRVFGVRWRSRVVTRSEKLRQISKRRELWHVEEVGEARKWRDFGS